MSAVSSFVGERLTQARKARGVSAGDFADMVGLDRVTISRYETGKMDPKPSTIYKMAEALNFPTGYFSRELNSREGSGPLFWRARLTAPVKMRERTAVRLEWLEDIIEFLEEYFDFPDMNLPDLGGHDALTLSENALENAAAALRQHWSVSSGPLPNSIGLVEANGVLVSRCSTDTAKLDAVSRPQHSSGHPYMLLSRDGDSACRQRFDVCHELAHLVIHRNVTESMMKDKATYKAVERQADYFASCLLLPAQDFADELFAPTLDAFMTMKERWRVSIAAMIMRCKALEILDKDQASRMFIAYSRRGWRNGEPLDSAIEKESPTLLKSSIEILLEQNVYSSDEILGRLPIPVYDLEQLCELDTGTLNPSPPVDVQPKLKQKGNVVSLSRHKKPQS
ncbi:conserved domain protein [gamma proteobacterium NOR5-3]|nr:conserved domain protein [gamma proteobacterium NOR5-3]